MMRPALRISAAQFASNLDAVTARLAPSRLMLVMKDDAYGHGLSWAVETASAAGVRHFGGYDVRTALGIREDLETPATVFAWATSTDDEIAEAIVHDIDLGVGTAGYLERVIAQAGRLGRAARVHLKIDSGLHRNGVRPEEWESFVDRARAAERRSLLRIVGIWSHLSEASDEEDDESQTVFLHALGVLQAAGSRPDAVHLTASAASWARPELRGSVCRIGAFCYGIRSADGPDLDGILPIASLVAPVLAVSEDEVTVGIGSFDGVPSSLVGAPVGSPGGRRQLLRIDETTAVVSGWSHARPGDEVVLFGPGAQGEVSATTLAERIDTVGEEILTRLSSRVRREPV